MENELLHITNQNKTDDANKDFELSHIIGLNSKIREPVQCHPTMNETILYSVGGKVIAEDSCDKNNQVFFRHGNREISSFKISNTGRFLAVGFSRGENNFDKKLPVSIILWDYLKKEIIYELTGLYKAINLIEFSQDDKFISALSQENSFYIWDLETGFKCYSKLHEYKIDLIYWTAMTPGIHSSGRPEYTITITSANGLSYLQLFFELKSMQYNSKHSKFTLPSTGLVRNFTSAFYDPSVNALYLGTSGGEICVFSMDNLIFKMSFNAINNGVTSIVYLTNENCLIIGGGDGRIKKLYREGVNASTLKHSLILEIQLNTKISSLCLAADSKELVCSLANGYIYRVLTNDLSYTLHSISHITNVNDVCFINKAGNKSQKNVGQRGGLININDRCFTVDDFGNLFLWDLNEFNIKGMYQSDSAGKSLTWGDDGNIINLNHIM
jgi:WD40 repeat protein